MRTRTFVADSVFSIDYESLSEVKTLLIDYDGTLTHKPREYPSEKHMKLLVKLAEEFRVVIFSNNRRFPTQRQAFFSQYGIEYVHTHKPFGRCTYEKAVLIGDKWLTDVVYGWRNSIPVFLVRSVSE